MFDCYTFESLSAKLKGNNNNNNNPICKAPECQKTSVALKWRNWYQNEVYAEIKRVGSRDNMKHNERNDNL